MSDPAPPARPHHSDAPVKITRPAMKIARRPSRSASFPPVRSSTPNVRAEAFTTHSSSEIPMPRSFWIDGSATFTTVLSSMIMNSPTATATSVHHFRFSGVKSRARTTERLKQPLRPTWYGYPYASRVSDFIWSPTAEDVESANLTRLARRLGVEHYTDLHRISIEEPERFWPAVIEDLGLEFSVPWEQVVDTSRGREWATWFTGGKLNLAWNCVHRWAAGELAEEEAAVWQGEDGARLSLTWRELSKEVFRLAEGLASLGIGEGDAVGIFLPMSPQVAVASHACAHLGAVQVPIFSGFAPPAIAARLADAKAKALITADGSLRRGQTVRMKEIADEALRSAPTVTHTVVWRRLGGDTPMVFGRDVFWDELVEGSSADL